MPGFTLTAIVSLALGIGATTAVFSVVYAILLDPYPYRDANRMIHMRLIMPDGQLRGFLGITARSGSRSANRRWWKILFSKARGT